MNSRCNAKITAANAEYTLRFPYAAFFCCALVLAQRARCAAAILLRAARLIVRTGVDATRLVFAHRAFCASEIFRRAAAESVRFGRCALAWPRVPLRPTNSPTIWIACSKRLRSCSSSFNTPARFAMVFPLTLFEITAPSILHATLYSCQASVRCCPNLFGLVTAREKS